MTGDLVLCQKWIPKLTFSAKEPFRHWMASATFGHLHPSWRLLGQPWAQVSLPLTLLILPLFTVWGPSSGPFQSRFLPPPTPGASLPPHLCVSHPRESGQTPTLSEATQTNGLPSSIHQTKKGREEERTQLQPQPAHSAAGMEGFCPEPKKRSIEAECGQGEEEAVESLFSDSWEKRERVSRVGLYSQLGPGLWVGAPVQVPARSRTAVGPRHPTRLLWHALENTPFLCFHYLPGAPAFLFYWFQKSSLPRSQCGCNIGRGKTVHIPHRGASKVDRGTSQRPGF